PAVTLIPCELREHNADLLRGIILDLAHAWGLPEDFRRWVQAECVWLNTLVDRIVTDPKDHPLMATDAMLAVCEPYALWAVQHKLTDIAKHHKQKVEVRLVPTRDEFRARFGRPPSLLDEVLSLPQPPGGPGVSAL